jgi:hypothetical protein
MQMVRLSTATAGGNPYAHDARVADTVMRHYTHDFVGQIVRHGVGKSRVITYKVPFMPPHFEATLPLSDLPTPASKAKSRMSRARRVDAHRRRAAVFHRLAPQIKANTGLDVGDDEMRFRMDDQDRVDVPQRCRLLCC